MALSAIAVAFLSGCSSGQANHDWPAYLGGVDSAHYSPLSQIHRGNVSKLERAWTFHTGEFGQMQCNPVIADSSLYCTSTNSKLFALNAATGEKLWVFDPAQWPTPPEGTSNNRGVMYWSGDHGRRVYYSAGNFLFCIDAETGLPVSTFGNGGAVDLKQGLGRDIEALYVVANTPGVIFEDLLILGSRVSETNPAAPGHLRAFDIHTGEQKWIFHTIPHPGEVGYDTWPEDAWTRAGGANSWAGMSLDLQRGIVFVPTGSAAYDFYGADRKGDNLFANTLLAIDARSGKRIWHYQFVHHDIWDRDLPAPPNLVSVEHDGRNVDAVAQITKSAHVFLFDRETGEALYPVEEVAFPTSNIPGEVTSPTQPIPAKPAPFGREIFSEDQVTNRSPEATAYVLERLKRYRSTGPYTPGSREGTVILPGYDGGGEWGGAAVDPDTGILYVNASEMAWVLTMIEIEAGSIYDPANQGRVVYATQCLICHGIGGEGDSFGEFPALANLGDRLTVDEARATISSGRGRMPSFAHLEGESADALLAFLFADESFSGAEPSATNTGENSQFQSAGYVRFVDQDGYPALRPPWGTLNAIDLNRGELLWQVPLGNEPGLNDYSFAGGLPTGTENYGGPVVTKGGLIFIAATKDAKLRAFDKHSGEQLWEADLPAAGYATPSVYMVDGKQYVVVAAGGGKIGTKDGDAYVAFRLP